MSIIDNQALRGKCQIFTPEKIASGMLDLAGYSSNLRGKQVLENSCGDGSILVMIVERYINDALHYGLSAEEIQEGLQSDITAYEIDQSLFSACVEKLNAIAIRYNIPTVKWNIINEDFLKADNLDSFDYIIGNPPYICYSDLPREERDYLRGSFKTCKKGKFDYSYAFIEKSCQLLNENGSLVYIIPSNFFKNTSAHDMRQLIKEDLITIVDFPKETVFKDVLVSPAVIHLLKNAKTHYIKYQLSMNGDGKIRRLKKDMLGEKWYFSDSELKGKRVGDYFVVANAVATLCNKVFIIKEYSIEGDYCHVDGDKIELELLAKAVSPKSKRYAKENELIIFPYRFNKDGTVSRYSNEEIQRNFPSAMKYMEKHKEELLKRSSDENAEWYEYGRSQALQKIKSKKLIISSVISEDTKSYLVSSEEIPYAGLFITQKGSIPLTTLSKVFLSKRFKEYVSRVGIRVSGTSRRITARDLENYSF